MDRYLSEYLGYDQFPADKYVVTFNTSELITTGYGPRLIIWFAIMEGDDSGELLPYFCRVSWKDKRKRATIFGKGSKYERLLRDVGWDGKRKDRVGPSKLNGFKFEAKVVDVIKRGDGTSYKADQIYSKIETLVKL
jgi:hypothetical protein